MDLYDLTTYDNVVAHLDEAEATEVDRPLMESMIIGTSRLAELTMRRRIISRLYKWANEPGVAPVDDSLPVLYGSGDVSMFFEYPLTKVDSLVVNGVALVEGEHFQITANTGKVRRVDSGFFPRTSVVKVEVTAGYLTEAALPAATNPTLRAILGWPEGMADLQQSVTQQTADFYRRRTRQREGLDSVSYESQTFSYMTDSVLPEVLNVWLRHQRGQVL